MATIWVVVVVILAGILLSIFAKRSVAESVIIDTNGILFTDRYAGPFTSLSELNVSSLHLSESQLQFSYNDIQTIMFGKYWRWWLVFAMFGGKGSLTSLFGRGYWTGLTYLIIQTKNSEFFLKQISPPLPSSYKDRIIANLNQLGRSNLLNPEVHKL